MHAISSFRGNRPRPSKSYLTPPRWRGLGNGSTPVSHHITIRLRKVDENFDPAKFRRLCSAFPHLGFGVPCWCGVGGHRPGGRPCWSPGPCTGKYLDPVKKRIYVALRTRHMWVLKFPGTVLVACRRKGSRVTWRLAVQSKMR